MVFIFCVTHPRPKRSRDFNSLSMIESDSDKTRNGIDPNLSFQSGRQILLNSVKTSHTENFFPRKKSKKKAIGSNHKGHQLPPMQNFLNPSSLHFSGSEAEFLTRQLHQTSSFSGIDQGRMEDPTGILPPMKSRSAGGSDQIESFREEISNLQKQLSASQQIVSNKERELEKKDQKLKSLSVELEQVHKNHVDELSKVQEKVSGS